jgi:hypothetical protein
MKKTLHKWLMLLYSVGIGNLAFGQATETTANINTSTTIDAFNTAIGQQSRLYSGTKFEPYQFITKGNAFFQDFVDFNPGSVVYDGITYTNVPLMYDLDRDMVVSLLFNKFTKYNLISERVAEFDLLNHHFIRIQQDSLNKQITTGFYDELYDNKLQLIAKRVKFIRSYAGTYVMQNEFNYKQDYYLKKGTVYYKVNSQGSFIDVLKDHKNELKKFIKDKKIKFNKDPEGAMVMMAGYYDSLSN